MGIIENALDRLRKTGGVPMPMSGASQYQRTRLPELQSWGSSAEPTSVATRIIELDRPRLRYAGYLPEVGCEGEFANYYQQIKRPLIHHAFAAGAGPEQRLIMVTSALPGEGKTFTTLNLALSMARERDMSVLLVDADFPKAHIGRALEVNDELGLLDAVADESQDVESFVMRSNVRGLEILPGGRSNGQAAELVASARMSHVVARLTARNPRRLVLFDAAPLLASSDARNLSHIPGQIVLVARAGVTPQQALLEAIGHIDKKKLQGLVLNDSYDTSNHSYYGYPGEGSAAEGAQAAAD